MLPNAILFVIVILVSALLSSYKILQIFHNAQKEIPQKVHPKEVGLETSAVESAPEDSSTKLIPHLIYNEPQISIVSILKDFQSDFYALKFDNQWLIYLPSSILDNVAQYPIQPYPEIISSLQVQPSQFSEYHFHDNENYISLIKVSLDNNKEFLTIHFQALEQTESFSDILINPQQHKFSKKTAIKIKNQFKPLHQSALQQVHIPSARKIVES